MSKLMCEAILHSAGVGGDVVEICFRGRHDASHAPLMGDFIGRTIALHHPVGVLFNLLGYRYAAGDDIGVLLTAFVRREGPGPRPGCIVANGGTARSLRRLFDMTKVSEVFGIEFVGTVEEGLATLSRRLARAPA